MHEQQSHSLFLIWPQLATFGRSGPTYLKGWSALSLWIVRRLSGSNGLLFIMGSALT